MKLHIGKYQIEIKAMKNKYKDQLLSYSDIKKVNDSHLNYLNNLSIKEIKKRIDSVSVNDLNTPENCAYAKKLLTEHGIFIVPDFLTKELSESLGKETQKSLLKIDELIDNVYGYYEDENLVIQKEEIRFNSYKKLANYSKPIITVRQGQDQGMIDVFNFDKLPVIKNLKIQDHINQTGLNDIIKGDNIKKLSLSNINVYRNIGITQTRGFHMDDLSNTIKGFIYLSDVEDLHDGPYCFCKGTHSEGAFRKVNQALSQMAPNKTETPLVPMDSILPILAKKGSLVVSNQTGFHRGIPQKETAERLLLVIRYM